MKQLNEAARLGAGIKNYQELFNSIEASIKQNEPEELIKAKVDKLSTAITKQMELVKSQCWTTETDPIWRPYILELNRRVKTNWHPSRQASSYRVIILFKVQKDGKLTDYRIKQSVNAVADREALAAVQASSPFRPWPGTPDDNQIDVEFTLDYNKFETSQR